MYLHLNQPIPIPRPLLLDESTGNLRPVDRAQFSVEPPGLAFFDGESFLATGLTAGEGECTVTAEHEGKSFTQKVRVIVPAAQTVEVPVPGEPPPFAPSKLVIPGE